MARKLRADEAQVFHETLEGAAPASDLDALLHELAERTGDISDLTTIHPAWIKGSLPEPFGS